MSSRKELEMRLDQLSLNTPYKIIADIRKFHQLIHSATEIDEGVPYSQITAENVVEAVNHLPPSRLKQATDLEDEILDQCDIDLSDKQKPEWAIPALKLAYYLRSRHFPPEEINHKL